MYLFLYLCVVVKTFNFIVLRCCFVDDVKELYSARMRPARATRFFITVVARKSEKRIARAGFKFLRAT